MNESICEESSLAKLLVKGAELRISKVKSEKEFISIIGDELSREEKLAMEKKRCEILYQLELEGAEIELEFTEKYRSRLAGLVTRFPGVGLSLEGGCWFCSTCVTTACLTCVACASCIGPCATGIL